MRFRRASTRSLEWKPIANLSMKRGFSILESIIVLAITALALTTIYSIGSKATDAAFRLGRRALAAADQQVDTESTREVLRAFSLPPADGREAQLPPLDASSAQLEGPAILARNTPCGPAGPAAALALTLTSDQQATRITCSLGGGPPVLIGVIPRAGAVLQYLARDQPGWSSSWAPNLDGGRLLQEVEPPSRRVLYVRIVDPDGHIYMLERLTSARPGWDANAI
jgi:prepilin-type N-terminal cleavage/methylation domain-containing protein